MDIINKVSATNDRLMRFKKNICIFVVIVFVSLCLLEALSYLLPKKYYEWEWRYLFYSHGAVQNVGDKYWTYRPNTLIRSVTAYSYPWATPIVEGDVYFKSNNLGLVQQFDVDTSKQTIVVIGDSFTEGQTCEPWFWTLEKDFNLINVEFQLANMGIEGTGPQGWHLFFSDIQKQINIKKVIILFIGSDFVRGVSHWSPHDLNCIDKGNCSDQYWWGIDLGVRNEELNQIIKLREFNRYGNSIAKGIDGFLRKWSNFYRFFRSTYALVGKKHDSQSESVTEKVNIDAIHAIVSSIGANNVYMIAISERHEAEEGRFNDKTKKIISRLEDIVPSGHVDKILLKSTDFFEHDGHPNKEGYKKIEAKVMSIVSVVAPSSIRYPLDLKKIDSSTYFEYGWHDMEGAHVWSQGRAIFSLPVPSICHDKKCCVEFEFGVLPISSVLQHVVTFKSFLKNEWSKTLTFRNNNEKICIPLDGKSVRNYFMVEYPYATSPSLENICDDRRKLGVFVDKIDLKVSQ